VTRLTWCADKGKSKKRKKRNHNNYDRGRKKTLSAALYI